MMKVCFYINSETKVEFHKDEAEPEIVIETSDGLIEVFGTSQDLKKFAKDLYEKVGK